MLIKTRGIVLRAVKYSETSLIIDIFTETNGLRSYIISGVRASKSKVAAGLLQVMSLVDIVAYDKPDKLNRITEIHAAHVYTDLPFDIRRSSVGIFMAEVARRTLRNSEENAELFDFLFQIFQFLDETQQPFHNLHIAFLIELSRHLGFCPEETDEFEPDEALMFDLKEGVFIFSYGDDADNPSIDPTFLSENLTDILRGLLKTPWHDVAHLKITREDRRLLIAELLRFYQFHIEDFKEIQSFKILQEIL